MKKDAIYSIREGFAILGPALTDLRQALDRRFLEFADQCGAARMAFPPLTRLDDLASLDYFQNFPHLALLAAPLDQAKLAAGDGSLPPPEGKVPSWLMASSEYALPSAACYAAYLDLRDSTLASTQYVTAVANCFRNETAYEGLRRLHGFTMREIVCIGTSDDVQAHLEAYKPRVLGFAHQLGLQLEVRPSTDPFFQADAARAGFQALFPVKEEFVHGDSLAIGSLNFHRNFFGERCRIRLASGELAFTSCVAFGLERWLAALLETLHDDVTAIEHALARASVAQPVTAAAS
jgi:seryl-tRNA synthetase